MTRGHGRASGEREGDQWFDRELGDAELRRGARFQATDRELQNPFLSAGFARAGRRGPDRARVAVFEDAAAIVGFLPFELRVAWGRHRDRPAASNNRQGFVHEPGLPWCGAVRAAPRPSSTCWSWTTSSDRRPPRRSLELVAAPVIDTGTGWDDYLGRLKKTKNVKTILYKERKLRREHADVLFRSGPAKDCAELRQLVAWKSQQYRRSGWPDLFARRGVPTSSTCWRGPSPGSAVGSSLRHRRTLVATDLSLTTDTVFAGWFAAHDPECARFSPARSARCARSRPRSTAA